MYLISVLCSVGSVTGGRGFFLPWGLSAVRWEWPMSLMRESENAVLDSMCMRVKSCIKS